MPANNLLMNGFSPRAILKCLALATAVLLLGELLFFRPVVLRYDDSIRWPKTTGVVSATGLKLYLHKANLPLTFTPTVVYSFAVQGIPRTATRVDFSERLVVLPREAALRWLETNYPVGKTVTVYYDPTDADTAVLVPGAPDWVFICNWSIALTAVCCLAATILYRRSKRAQSDLGDLVSRDARRAFLQKDHAKVGV